MEDVPPVWRVPRHGSRSSHINRPWQAGANCCSDGRQASHVLARILCDSITGSAPGNPRELEVRLLPAGMIHTKGSMMLS